MLVSCWKALGSPTLTTYKTTLQAFNGQNFVPEGVLPNFSIELGGKIVYVDVEVINDPLDYKLLLGCSWFSAMNTVVSFIFYLLFFPHEGKIVTIDKLNYCMSSLQIIAMGNSVPLVGNHPGEYVGVGLFKSSSLIGVFPKLAFPNIPSSSSKSLIHMISFDTYGPHRPLDPWVVSPIIMEFDQASEHPFPPFVEEFASLVVSSIPLDGGQKHHHNIEYEQVSLPAQAVIMLVPHECLDDESSS